jgi:predicted DNA-binding ribbon-helix-helix protein
MPSRVQPRRIIINGHPTSIRLEPAFWGWLREIAAECGMTAKAFIEGVVAAKDPKCPLASALRLYIANYFRSSAPRYGLVDPASRLAFRIERPRRSRKGSKKTEATVEIKPPFPPGW